MGDYTNASCLQHTDSSQNLTTTLNPHDHRRREELTLEQQHPNDPSSAANPPHIRITYQSGITSAIRASSRAPANRNGGEGRRRRGEARCEEEERSTAVIL